MKPGYGDGKADSAESQSLEPKDDEYVRIHERFYDLQEQHPFILKVLEGKDDLPLTGEEHDILLDYLALYRKMDTKERIHIYFLGHTDALAYLKKQCALNFAVSA